MRQFCLPNGQLVWGEQCAETMLLWRQVQGYFKHGIAVQADDVVIDVGANSGLFAALASEGGRKPLQILALEPMPAVFALLQANIRIAGIRALAVRSAVGAQAGTLRMTYYPRASMLSTAYPHELNGSHTREGVRASFAQLPQRWRWLARLPRGLQNILITLGLRWLLQSQVIDCPTRTLSSLIDEHALPQVHLLKIDAERAEWDVLQGIEAAHWPRIEQIVMEVHDTQGRLQTIRDLLAAKGFTHIVCEQENKMKAFDVWQLWARRS